MTTAPTAAGSPTVVVGLGSTGLSCVRYLLARGESVAVVDSRREPPGLAPLQAQLQAMGAAGVEVTVALGDSAETLLRGAKRLLLSPGVSPRCAAVQRAVAAGAVLSGDIDIFSREADAPIVGVTGSNGKSTVVAMVADIMAAAGVRCGVGGNLDGARRKPALDLLGEGKKDCYVLELSSFQLETTASLGAEVAALLNLSPDHMDRHASLAAYLAAKRRIFIACRQVVVNLDDPHSAPPEAGGARRRRYRLGPPPADGAGLIRHAGEEWLAWGRDAIMPSRELRVPGRHNLGNALAAATLAVAMDVPLAAVREGLRGFAGLPHRCQWLARRGEVDYYNDSKATNVAAAATAVASLGRVVAGAVVLIAGGRGKEADFRPLRAVARYLRGAVLMGEQAEAIAAALAGSVPMARAVTMDDAVTQAADLARSGDGVLLSPACASFDMFRDFAERGQAFAQAVERIP